MESELRARATEFKWMAHAATATSPIAVMSGMDFTDRAQGSLSAAFEMAKDYAHAQLAPAHIALALLLDDTSNSQGVQSTNKESQSLFKSVCQKAGVNIGDLENELRTALRLSLIHI